MADGFAAMAQMLRTAGLGDLEQWARDAFQRGLSPDEVALELEQQQVYRTRFSAMFTRREQGLAPISALDVIDYERRTAEYEQLYGLPRGFVDTNQALINDVSATEMGQRLSLTADYVRSRADVMAVYEHLFDQPLGAAMASFIDPQKSLPMLNEQLQMARVGADAERQGFGAIDTNEAMMLARSGLTVDDVAERFAVLRDDRELLAPLLGEGMAQLSRADQLGLVAGSNPAVLEVIERRRAERKAMFEGGGGFGLSNDGVIGAGSAS
jgi:hypothetical protein